MVKCDTDVGTICRVTFVNHTDQIGPKQVKMTAKTATYKKKMTQCFIFLFANETKGTFCVFQPWNPSVQPKTSHQSNLSMKTADQIRKLFRNRPKLLRRCFVKASLLNLQISVVCNKHISCISFEFSNFSVKVGVTVNNSTPYSKEGRQACRQNLLYANGLNFSR